MCKGCFITHEPRLHDALTPIHQCMAKFGFQKAAGTEVSNRRASKILDAHAMSALHAVAWAIQEYDWVESRLERTTEPATVTMVLRNGHGEHALQFEADPDTDNIKTRSIINSRDTGWKQLGAFSRLNSQQVISTASQFIEEILRSTPGPTK
jgi:hypothetical protein